MLHVALAIAASLVGLAFFLSTLDRWLAQRRPHELVWTFAFAFFALAAAFLATGAQAGWTSGVFKGFYLFGAIVNVPFLALGSLLLMNREHPERHQVLILATAAFVIFSTGVIVATPLTGPLPYNELAQGSDVFGPLPRLLAALGSGIGALIVFGCAILSALRYRKARNVLANGLIATGTAVLGMSGMLNSIADAMVGFSITLVLGICILFSGFLVATSGRSTRPLRVKISPNSLRRTGNLSIDTPRTT